MPHADIHPLRMVHKLQKTHDVIEIIQRLADAHKDDIRYRLAGIQL